MKKSLQHRYDFTGRAMQMLSTTRLLKQHLMKMGTHISFLVKKINRLKQFIYTLSENWQMAVIHTGPSEPNTTLISRPILILQAQTP